MILFIVIERRADGKYEGLGEHGFRVAPRIGEYIEMNDDEGMAQIYEVIAVIHPLKLGANAGDLIIRHLASTIDFHRNL